MAEYQHLIVEECEGYLILRINRPEKKNALNRLLRSEILDFLETYDGSVNAIILTGMDDSFSAGIDLSEKSGATASDEVWQIAHGIYGAKSVFVAAVNGFARGGGTTFTNACDIAIASEKASFGVPEVGFGVYATVAGPTTQLSLPRKVASQMILTGEPMDAHRAAEVFLVNEVVPHAALMARAEEVAKHLASLPQAGLFASKQGVNTLPFGEAMRREGEALTKRLNAQVFAGGGGPKTRFRKD